MSVLLKLLSKAPRGNENYKGVRQRMVTGRTGVGQQIGNLEIEE